ncbi:hypothetical protein SPHINGOAX6_70571 [Sphingomonas sp. AX6]|nr:hypothetical protein SPHINGOAX6_70571 [Sphingomonas sp. AX6]
MGPICRSGPCRTGLRCPLLNAARPNWWQNGLAIARQPSLVSDHSIASGRKSYLTG